MMDSSSIAPIQKSVTHFFSRFHFIMFFVLISTGLGIAIFFLNGAIASSDPSATIAPNNNINFDQSMIDRLNKLREAGQSTTPIEVNGRVNPF